MSSTGAIPGQSRHANGLTLLELLIVLALTALLLAGLLQIAAAGAASTRLQRNQAHLQENARLIITKISRFVQEAGFNPTPWDPYPPIDSLTGDTADRITAKTDRLGTRSLSDLNCFDNRNPVLQDDGMPAFHVRESVFALNSSNGLTWECRYGPGQADLVTEVRRQGLVENVESFQVLYGEDTNGDFNIDRWVAAGQWGEKDQVLGVKVGVLLVSEDRLDRKQSRTFSVLDETVKKSPDGRMRRVVEFAVALRGRTG